MEKKYEHALDSLGSKNVLIIGIIFGFLIFCMFGFVILGISALNDGINTSDIKEEQVATSTKTTTVVPKTDKPKAELFIMSYCPYGLQMQKAYLPVMELLGKKADIDIKFVSYAMHEKKEIDENTRQYCIQKEQTEKFVEYSKCFTETGKFDACLTSVKIDEGELDACIIITDKDFKITELYNDKSTWLNGRFPIYPIFKELNTKYRVQGSPTLVINGVQATVERTPEAIKKAICGAFNKPPAECTTVLSTQGPQAGFGSGTGTATNQEAACH